MFEYDHLKFVELSPEDLPFLMEMRNLPESWAGTRDAFPVATLHQQQKWFESLHGEHDFVLKIVDEGKWVGIIRIGNIELKTRSIGITGLQTFPGNGGHGYGTRAIRGAAEWAIRELGFHRVTAEGMDDNPAVQKAITKAGFTLDGVKRSYIWRGGKWHDFNQYSILEGEL